MTSMQDARKVINATGAFVAVSVMALFSFALYALIFHLIPTENASPLLVLLGSLTTNVSNVVGFYFGSSAANRTKDATIQTLASTNDKAQDALPGVPGAPDKTTPVKPEPKEP